MNDQVVRLALLAIEAGCHGVVASPQEAQRLRELLPEATLVVTPGTQLPGDAKHDHARTATPAAAIKAGATHLIVGRAVYSSANPAAAFAAFCAQVEESLSLYRH